MQSEPQITRLVWREGNHVVLTYDNDEVELREASRDQAATIAEREGLLSVRAPLGRLEWGRPPQQDVGAWDQLNDDRSLDVLVIDDNPDVANSTIDVLRLGGLRVTWASTVEEARDVIDDVVVRSLVLDHTLVESEADWTGIRHGVPIILVSGIGREEMEALEKKYGERLFACASKPMAPSELIEMVRTAIQPAV